MDALALVLAAGPSDERNPYPPRRRPEEYNPPSRWDWFVTQVKVIVGMVLGAVVFYLESTEGQGRPYVLMGAIAFFVGPAALQAFLQRRR